MTATALINFGALVAFTFVNLSVFNHFWRRKGYNKTWKGSRAPPDSAANWRGDGSGPCGLTREATSMTLGLVVAALGAVSDLADPRLPSACVEAPVKRSRPES